MALKMSSGGLGGKGNWLDIFGLLNFIAKLRNVFHRQHWYLSSCVSKEAYLCEATIYREQQGNELRVVKK